MSIEQAYLYGSQWKEVFDVTESSAWIRCDLAIWGAILQGADEIKLKKGEFLFNQGDTVQCIYIVKSGRLIQFLIGIYGDEKIVTNMGVGAICGESAIYHNEPILYGTKAISDVTLYRISVPIFRSYLASDTSLNQVVLNMLIRKINVMAMQISDLSFGNVYQRLAGELYHASLIFGTPVPEGICLDHPLTHQDLANKINASRETVSRHMGRLEKEGIIMKAGKRYIVLSQKALKDIYSPINYGD